MSRAVIAVQRPIRNFVSGLIHLVAPAPGSLAVNTSTFYVCIRRVPASPYKEPHRIMNAPANPSSGNRSDDLAPRKLSPLRIVFRVIRWTTYAAAIITLLMVFHATPPPVIATSPPAAARVEHKVEAVDQTLATGQSATLRLVHTQLNSYLA